MKTIEQINHEYSCSLANKGSTFNEYISFILFTRNAQLFNDAVNIISNQYSIQFKQQNDILRDRVKELEECLKAVLEINKAHKFNGHLVNDRIESIINKCK